MYIFKVKIIYTNYINRLKKEKCSKKHGSYAHWKGTSEDTSWLRTTKYLFIETLFLIDFTVVRVQLGY